MRTGRENHLSLGCSTEKVGGQKTVRMIAVTAGFSSFKNVFERGEWIHDDESSAGTQYYGCRDHAVNNRAFDCLSTRSFTAMGNRLTDRKLSCKSQQ